MAEKWKQFEATQYLYPNLEYMPSTAAEPRESHKGVVKLNKMGYEIFRAFFSNRAEFLRNLKLTFE